MLNNDWLHTFEAIGVLVLMTVGIMSYRYLRHYYRLWNLKRPQNADKYYYHGILCDKIHPQTLDVGHLVVGFPNQSSLSSVNQCLENVDDVWALVQQYLDQIENLNQYEIDPVLIRHQVLVVGPVMPGALFKYAVQLTLTKKAPQSIDTKIDATAPTKIA